MSQTHNAPVASTTDRATVQAAYRAAKSALHAAEEANGGFVAKSHPAQVAFARAAKAWAAVG